MRFATPVAQHERSNEMVSQIDLSGKPCFDDVPHCPGDWQKHHAFRVCNVKKCSICNKVVEVKYG